jgi:hypothetical protein
MRRTRVCGLSRDRRGDTRGRADQRDRAAGGSDADGGTTAVAAATDQRRRRSRAATAVGNE